MLHPESMSLSRRKECLFALKELGYQVGSGFMVGSPYQSVDNIVSDIRFLQELSPDMIGIGPFVHHWSTPFRDFENGSAELTVRLVAVLRLLFPYSLIPATTSLATIAEENRKKALLSGANVIMPNPFESPEKIRTLRPETIIIPGECAGSGWHQADAGRNRLQGRPVQGRCEKTDNKQ